MRCPIAETDVRSIARLLGEVSAFEAAPAGKRRFLLDELCKLVGADSWVWALSRHPGNGKPQVYVNMLHGGFDDDRFTRLLKAIEHPDMSWVAKSFYGELERRKPPLTPSCEEALPVATFEQTVASELWRQADIGPVLLSTRPLDSESGSSIGLYRRYGAKKFSERECTIAHLILTEVGWLHETGWPEDREATVPQLPSRQRIILNLLLEGLDRKTIADQLGISVNTVAGYCKEIYRHFKVNSQAGLMARFYLGNGGDQA